MQTRAHRSAGILLYRVDAHRLEVLLVHPGGPYWATRDEGAWSIPKGELDDGEDALQAARREFEEETGGRLPDADPLPLDPVRQPGGKVVHAWAMKGAFDPAALRSNRFLMEWPPSSGQYRDFPEVDRAGWFVLEAAQRKILKGQVALLRQLAEKLGLPW
jgi:predicted NUDIX family NTP pyrophosphohydrolase